MSECTLYNIDDPKAGLLDDTAVAHLVKTIRCELVTYYQATYRRKQLFNTLGLPYFDLDNNQWGAFYLDLKVVDSAGIPGTNTVFDNKVAPNATHSTLWQFGPNIGIQNTYELTWTFAIRQNAGFLEPVVYRPAEAAVAHLPSDLDTFQCYKGVSKDLEGLAAGNYPELQLYDRIRVNGNLTLATWLLKNSEVMASGYYFPNNTLNYEMSFPGQMIYTFTVAPSVGIDARYSLVTTRWNPLTTDLSASKAQTDLIAIYINGVRGSTFNNAKAANQLITPEQKPILPTHVVIDGQEKVLGVVIEPKPAGIQERKELPLNKYPSYTQHPSTQRGASPKDRGYSINPIGIIPLTPSSQQ